MKVFISWSGELSKKLGEVLRTWLPSVLQMVEPYFTPADIEKGQRWNTEIATELGGSKVGIFCVTRENLGSDWLLFEAGALSKQLKESRVCPILFNVDNSDIAGPLCQFQTTNFGETDIKKLVETINSAAGDAKLKDDVLENVFNKWWPDLKSKIEEILENHESQGNTPARPEREILEEILALSRLNQQRSQPKISPEATNVLVASFINTHNAIGSHLPHNLIMDKLHNMNKPILYFAKAIGDEDLIKELDNLTFKCTSPSSPDDDIPF